MKPESAQVPSSFEDEQVDRGLWHRISVWAGNRACPIDMQPVWLNR